MSKNMARHLETKQMDSSDFEKMLKGLPSHSLRMKAASEVGQREGVCLRDVWTKHVGWTAIYGVVACMAMNDADEMVWVINNHSSWLVRARGVMALSKISQSHLCGLLQNNEVAVQLKVIAVKHITACSPDVVGTILTNPALGGGIWQALKVLTNLKTCSENLLTVRHWLAPLCHLTDKVQNAKDKLDMQKVYQQMAIKFPTVLLSVLEHKRVLDFKWNRACQQLAATHLNECLEVVKQCSHSSFIEHLGKPLAKRNPLGLLDVAVPEWLFVHRYLKDPQVRSKAFATALASPLHDTDIDNILAELHWSRTRDTLAFRFELICKASTGWWDRVQKCLRDSHKMSFAGSPQYYFKVASLELKSTFESAALGTFLSLFLKTVDKQIFFDTMQLLLTDSDLEAKLKIALLNTLRTSSVDCDCDLSEVFPDLQDMVREDFAKPEFRDLPAVERCRQMQYLRYNEVEGVLKETINDRNPEVRVSGLTSLWKAAVATGDMDMMVQTLKWTVKRLKKDHEEVTVPVHDLLLHSLTNELVQQESITDLLKTLVEDSLQWKGTGASSIAVQWTRWAAQVSFECLTVRNGKHDVAREIADHVISSLLDLGQITEWALPTALREILRSQIAAVSVADEGVHRVVLHLIALFKKCEPALGSNSSIHYSNSAQQQISVELTHMKAVFTYIQRAFQQFEWSLFNRFREVRDYVLSVIQQYQFNAKCWVLPDLVVTDFNAWGDKRVLSWAPYKDMMRKALSVMKGTPPWGKSDGRLVTAGNIGVFIQNIPLTTMARATAFKTKGLRSDLAREVASWCNPHLDLFRDSIEVLSNSCVSRLTDIKRLNPEPTVAAAANLLAHVEWVPEVTKVAPKVFKYLNCNNSISNLLVRLPCTHHLYAVQRAAVTQMTSIVGSFSSIMDNYTTQTSCRDALRGASHVMLGTARYKRTNTDTFSLMQEQQIRCKKPKLAHQRGQAARRCKKRMAQKKDADRLDNVRKTGIAEAVIELLTVLGKLRRFENIAQEVANFFNQLSTKRHKLSPTFRKVLGCILDIMCPHMDFTSYMASYFLQTSVYAASGWLDAAEHFVLKMIEKIKTKTDTVHISLLPTLIDGFLSPLARYKRRANLMLDVGICGMKPAELVAASPTLQYFLLKFREDQVHLLDCTKLRIPLLATVSFTTRRYAGQTVAAAKYLPFLAPKTQRTLWDGIVIPGTERAPVPGKPDTVTNGNAVALGCHLPFVDGPSWTSPEHPIIELIHKYGEMTKASKKDLPELSWLSTVVNSVITCLRSFDDVPTALQILTSHIDAGVENAGAIPSTACTLRCVNTTISGTVLAEVLSRKSTQIAARTQLCRMVVTLLYGETLKDIVWKEWRNENRGDTESIGKVNKGVKVSLVCTLVQSAALASCPTLWEIPASLLEEDDDTVYVANEMLQALAGTNGVETLNAACWPMKAPDGLAGLCAKFLNRGFLYEPAQAALSRWVDHVLSSNNLVSDKDCEEVLAAVKECPDQGLLLRCAYAVSQRGHPGTLSRLVSEQLEKYDTAVRNKEFQKLASTRNLLVKLAKMKIWDKEQRAVLLKVLAHHPVSLECCVQLILNTIKAEDPAPALQELLLLLEEKGWGVAHKIAVCVKTSSVTTETRNQIITSCMSHCDEQRRFLAAVFCHPCAPPDVVPTLLSDPCDLVAHFVSTE
eukprot:TRINITY_DN14828_c0_g1_i1.p1 TRINITY_DN14828_c0_g1~~TRINITY_DN14828_c0_g1_i1.p1  ORF type:complete len:1672 (+),score=272.02 TRINITY_DN14828_c0_g1_i1:41-5056(+)